MVKDIEKNAAVAAFYNQNYEKCLRIAVGLTKNLAEAEDLVMQCFLKWMEKEKVFSDSNIGAFIKSIKNQFLDGLKRKNKYKEIINNHF